MIWQFPIISTCLLFAISFNAGQSSFKKTNSDIFEDQFGKFEDQSEQDDEGGSFREYPRSFGPFSTSLGGIRLTLELEWSIFIHNPEDDTKNDIEIKVSTNRVGVNWIGFGFTTDNEFHNADWFVAWRSRKGRYYAKDCNSMKHALHFDASQDYDVTSPRHFHSFNFTVRRALDTADDFDVKLKAGKTSIIWATGESNRFSRIKSEIRRVWKSKTIVLFKEEREKEFNEPLATKTKKNTLHATYSTVMNSNENEGTGPSVEDHTSSKNETARNWRGSMENHAGKDKSKEDSRRIQKPTNKKQENYIGHVPDVATKKQENSPLTKEVKSNCTVLIKKTISWYDVLRVKENSVYYAIIGSSALLTGMIVIILACCCTSSSSSSSIQRSKVAFYKVDDYDDEQVEFLKERA